jgi:DNA-binding NtrC family response regulator
MSDQRSLRVLLTERDRPIKILLEQHLSQGHALAVAVRSGEEAQELLSQQSFDVSQIGFEVPGFGRIETRRRQREGEDGSTLLWIESDPAVPAADANGDASPDGQGSVAAGLDSDALLDDLFPDDDSTWEDQFLTKPMHSRDLRRIVQEIRHPGRLRLLRAGRPGQEPILGDSDAMSSVLNVVERVAAGQASVLIHGETGTGKTLVARRIHDLSPRADKRFVAINCSAFQDQLLESELFGHERGAFTGAVAAKQGLFEVADGGTLFLDEVGDMSSAMQAKLLQVLDDGELRRVGGNRSLRVDVRVIAASNKDLPQEVKAGRFREDLLFRLNVIHLKIPPLRERQGDVAVLIEHLLDRYRLPGRPRKQISPEAIHLLTHYSWPGNVRELANAIEGLTLLAPGDEIRAEDLPLNLRPRHDVPMTPPSTPLPLKEIERLHIEHTLRFTEGKKAAAARLLGIDVKTLNAKLRSYGGGSDGGGSDGGGSGGGGS